MAVSVNIGERQLFLLLTGRKLSLCSFLCLI